MKTCLAIMAKAPPAVVLRAIQSAAPFVDEVCLVVAPDDALRGLSLPIAGRIVLEPWQGYSATRALTLRHAETQGEWVVMLDAWGYFAKGSHLPENRDDADAYEIPIDCRFPGGRWRWIRAGHLMRSGVGFSWTGTAGSSLHEVLAIPEGARLKRWDGLVYREDPRPRTAKRDYGGDVAELGQSVAKMPTDTRGAFYFAQSLKDAGQNRAAYDAFLARAGMSGGFWEETFWAKLWAAKLAPHCGVSYQEIIVRHDEAHAFAPDRAEPLHEIARVYLERGDLEKADAAAAQASQKSYPLGARLFVDVCAYSPQALAAAGIEVE